MADRDRDQENGEDQLASGTAPKGDETEDSDRMEGSFRPGVGEYGPDDSDARETGSGEDEE